MTSLASPRGAAPGRASPGSSASAAFDAFICCTPAEAKEANAIREALKLGGIRCAIAPSEIRPGHQPVMILLLTRETSGSEAIETEVGRAVYRGFPLVVMRLESIPPGKRLAYYLTSRPFHRVDAVSPPLQQHLPRLTELVASTLGIAGALPGSPARRIDPSPAARISTGVGEPPEPRRPSASLASIRRERVAFISYSVADDELSDGALLGLRSRIHGELQIQLGAELRLWQNKHPIPPGAHWEETLRNAISESDFFIPIVTPGAIVSETCGVEYRYFVEREAALRRHDLIFPLLYVDVPGLGADDLPPDDPSLRLIAERGWFDWRELRYRPATSPDVARSAAEFCGGIVATLAQSSVSSARG
jgi:hypothetical protein